MVCYNVCMQKIYDWYLFFMMGMFGRKKREVEKAYGYEDEYRDITDEDEELTEESTEEDEENEHERGDLAIDLVDMGKEFEARAFIAGANISDIDISVTRESLTIHAEVKDDCGYEDSCYICRELFYGFIERSILIPEEVDVDRVEAHMVEGVLVIIMPKFNKQRQRKISVKKK